MEKSTAKKMLVDAATALKIGGTDPWKNQAAHQLAVVRTLLDAYNASMESDGDANGDVAVARKAAFTAVKGVGHGFACNASQFAQWVEKAEASGVSVDVAKDLDV